MAENSERDRARGTADRGTGGGEPVRVTFSRPSTVVGRVPRSPSIPRHARRKGVDTAFSKPVQAGLPNNLIARAIDAGIDAAATRLGVAPKVVRRALASAEREDVERKRSIEETRQAVEMLGRSRAQQEVEADREEQRLAEEEAARIAREAARSSSGDRLDPFRRVRMGQFHETVRQISKAGEDLADLSIDQAVGGVIARGAGVIVRRLGKLAYGARASGRALRTLARFIEKVGVDRRPVPPRYHFTDFGKYQMLVTGESFEYVVTSRGAKLQIDGFANSLSKPGLLDIVEAKYGNPFLTIEQSGHLPFWHGKRDQLMRLAQFAKDHPEHIGKVRLVGSNEAVQNLYQQILEDIPDPSLRLLIEVVGP